MELHQAINTSISSMDLDSSVHKKDRCSHSGRVVNDAEVEETFNPGYWDRADGTYKSHTIPYGRVPKEEHPVLDSH